AFVPDRAKPSDYTFYSSAVVVGDRSKAPRLWARRPRRPGSPPRFADGARIVPAPPLRRFLPVLQAFQVYQQQGYRGGCHPGNSAGLAHRFRPTSFEALPDFDRKTRYGVIVHILGNGLRLLFSLSVDFFLLFRN